MSAYVIEGVLKLLGVNQFTSDMNKVQQKTEDSVEKMSQSFNRFAKVMVAAFTTSKLANFAKTAMKTSAEISANNAQFAATFREVGDAATKTFEKVAKGTGVMATRLRTTGTKAFAQFKGAGIEANKALAETERYLNLAADAAAYYDISLEDADIRMRSFLRGNVEAGDAIGLFTSETQRNSKALELYGVKWKKLNEAQRQMVMLDIANTIYEQSGAIGQAARESGEYVNQSGNLTENLLQFKAVAGEKILEAYLAIMPSLSNAIHTLTDKVKYFNVWIDDNKETLKHYLEILKNIAPIIGGIAIALGGLAIIRKVVTWINAAKTAMLAFNAAIAANPVGAIVVALTSLVAVFATLWKTSNKFRGFWITLWADLKWHVNNFIDKGRVKFNEIVVMISELKDKIEEKIEGFKNKLFSTWESIKEKFAPVIETISGKWTTFKTTISEWWEQAKNAVLNFPEFIKGVFENALKKVIEFKDSVVEKFSEIWENIKGYFDKIGEKIAESFGGKVTEIFNGSKQFFSDMWDRITGTFTNLGEAFGESFGDGIKAALNLAIDGVEWVINKAVDVINTLIKVGNKIIPFWDPFNTLKPVELPRLADGGEITKDTLVEAGEAGPEVIIPLEKSKTVDMFAEKISQKISGGNASSFGTGSFSGTDSISAIHDAIYDVSVELDEIDKKVRSVKGKNDEWKESVEGISGYATELNNQYDAQYEKLQALNRQYELDVAAGGEMSTNAKETREEIEKLTVEMSKTQGAMDTTLTAFDELLKKSKSAAGENAKTWQESWAAVKKAVQDFMKKTKDDITNLIGELGSIFDTVTGYIDSYVGPLVESITALQDGRLEHSIETMEQELEAFRNANDEKLVTEEESTEKEKTALKAQLYDGKISYEEYVKGVEAQDKKLSDYKEDLKNKEQAQEDAIAAKKDELARKQFEANKGTQIANVWINAASGIMASIGQMGWLAGSIAAGLILTTAGVQTAAISEQQYVPALAEGGVVDKATYALMGEDGQEAVIPLEKSSAVSAFANEIANASGLRGEINSFREMVAEFFEWLREGNREVVIDGQTVAKVITPYVDSELARGSRMQLRRV